MQDAKKAAYLNDKIATYDTWIKQINSDIAKQQAKNELNNSIKAANALTNLTKKSNELRSIITNLGDDPINNLSKNLIATGVNSLGSIANTLTKTKDLSLLKAMKALMVPAQTTRLLFKSEKEKVPAYITTIDKNIAAINALIDQNTQIKSLNDKIKAITAKTPGDIIKELPPLFDDKPYNSEATTLAHAAAKKTYDARKANNIANLKQTRTFLQAAKTSAYLKEKIATYDQWIGQINKEIKAQQNAQAQAAAIKTLNNKIKAIGAKKIVDIIKELPPLLPEKLFNAASTTLGHTAMMKVVNGRNKNNMPSLNQTKSLHIAK